MSSPYRGKLEKPYTPVEVDDVTLVFPASVEVSMMPPMEDIPSEFRKYRGTKWNDFFNDMFYSGVDDIQFIPKEDIDPAKAWRHAQAVSGSYGPAHEYKEAAVAFLLSEWFNDVKYKKKNKKP